MGTVTHLLGIKFACKSHEDGNLDVHMDQTAFSDKLVQMTGISHNIASVKSTPYSNKTSIDPVNHIHLSSA